LSAQKGIGIDLLFQALAERLGKKIVKHNLCLPPSEGKLRGVFYQLNSIVDESYDEDGNCLLKVKLPAREWDRLIKLNEADIEGFIERKQTDILP
jgi:GTP-binding protein HflX